MNDMNFFRRVGSFFLDLIETVVIALAIFVIIYLFLFQPHQVRGNSMYPNFYDGEYILTDKVSYRLRDPKRGEVIIFQAPRNQEYDYIKRVVGLPGESIRIDQNKILVNNEILNEVYLPEIYATSPGSFLGSTQGLVIPEDQYFVLGDNRSQSSDSREWGLVPKENIIGKAWLRYWPTERLGVIPEVDYQLVYR